MRINDNIKAIKGVGKKAEELLQKLKINTVGELLYSLPVRYVDLTNPKTIIEMEESDSGAVKATVVRAPRWLKYSGKNGIFSYEVSDYTDIMDVVVFNQPYLFKNIHVGDEYIFEGRISIFRSRAQMQNPAIYKTSVSKIIPYYHTTQGLSQNTIRKYIATALDEMEIDSDDDGLSDEFKAKFSIIPLKEELELLHRPNEKEDYIKARRSTILRELLVYSEMTNIISGKDALAVKIEGAKESISEYTKKLGFKPTDAQNRAMLEIAEDISKEKAMNRLLQGDVGSGKTAVAFYAMYAAAKSGKVSLLMAPTQILCEQHFEKASRLFPEIGVAMLSGTTTRSERNAIFGGLKTGKIKILIGTHALVYSDFSEIKPSLIITDEQHRFGVAQRAALAGGDLGVHTLIMSATPIPRTLALIMFGKASVSVLDELPVGRKEIRTHIVPQSKRTDMYGFIKKHIWNGEQAYVVCPLVEDNPDINARSAYGVAEELSTMFKESEVLYGGSKDKTEIMERFKDGRTKLLISTTVVEVGVDVPNATIMVIENAERFGLSQLHQLRGRVGRGNKESFCFLVSGTKSTERLKIIKESTDGFYIAEKDLELRGSGDLIGQRQSGREEFNTADLIRDVELLELPKKILESKGFKEDLSWIHKKAVEKLNEEKMEVVFN